MVTAGGGVEVTPDGSPIAVYAALPASPEFDPVLAELRAASRVLDLGCGAGRLANLLVDQGHVVVGVDESAAALRHLDPAVEAVCARIEDLDLGANFGGVVLASNLVNTRDLEQRGAFLSCVRRHLHC